MVNMKNKTAFRKSLLASLVAGTCAAWGSQAFAGEVLDFNYYAGDGYILVDEEEGIAAPGIKVITGEVNLADQDVDPENNSSSALNCIIATTGAVCDGPPRTSKRVKYRLTGMNPLDTVFTTANSDGGTTEYFNFTKITNETGARLEGFKVQIGTGTGSDFVPSNATASEIAGLLQFDQGDNPRKTSANVPCGLFGTGCGGNPEEVGYFEDANTDETDKDIFPLVFGTDTLDFGALENNDYATIVGSGLLSTNQLPDGLFADDGDDTTEDPLVVWKAPGSDTWLNEYGEPLTQAEVDEKIAEVAAEIGDSFAGTYEGELEDMANANINYSFDIQDINGVDMTIRFVPVFAPIVAAAGSEYQFNVASSLDSSEIRFVVDKDSPEYAEYQTVIGAIEGLSSTAAKQQALERTGTSYLRNFGTQGFLIGRDQFDQVLSHLSRGRMGMTGAASGQMNASATSVEDISAVRLASADSSPQALAGLMAGTGSNGSMAITDRFSVFFGGSISQGEMDSTTNGAGADYDGYSLTGGADYRFFENARFGAAVGYGENDASVDDNRGDLKVDGTTAMLYGSYGQATGPFVDAAAGYSWLDYDNDRYIVIGDSYNERAESDTDATQRSFTLGGGYNFELGPVIAGPSARFEYHNLDIDGYEETGAGVLSMSVEDMEFKSRTMWFGGQVAMPMELDSGGSIRPHASLHLVKELENSGGTVLTNFTGGTLPFSTPIDGRDDEYFRAGLGLDANFTSFGQPMTVSLSYDGTLDNDDYDEHRGSVSVSMYF